MDGFVLVLFDVMHDHVMACMSYDGVSCDIMEILKNIKNVEKPLVFIVVWVVKMVTP